MDRIERINEILKQNPTDSFLLFALGLEKIKLGNEDEALQLFQSITLSNPDYSGVYYHLGKLLERKKIFDRVVLKLLEIVNKFDDALGEFEEESSKEDGTDSRVKKFIVMLHEMIPTVSRARADLKKLRATLERWRAPLIACGELLPMTATLFFSQIIGPAQIFCRAWLSGRDRSDPTQQADILIACAIRALVTPDFIANPGDKP